MGREDVLDALIAHGWIDGRRFVGDDDRTAQLISRRKQQAWSKTYKDRVERLRRESRMHPAGEEMVAIGRKSGLWSFFDDVDALIVPKDLAEDLDQERWDAFAFLQTEYTALDQDRENASDAGHAYRESC